MRKYYQLLILIFIPFIGHAEVMHTKQLRYQEFHDPGWMKLTDWKGKEVTASFKYELITFEDIDSWIADEPMTVILDDEYGIQLQRNITGKKYTVIFDDDSNPVNEHLNDCLSADQIDTLIIAECYSEAGIYYEKTAKSLHAFLNANGSDDLSKALAVEEQSWELYQETRNAAIREYLADKFGTKHTIINANDYHNQMKNRLDSLVRFLE